MIGAAKKKSMLTAPPPGESAPAGQPAAVHLCSPRSLRFPPGLSALWSILLLVVALCLPETRVWGFAITPQPASGVFESASPSSIGEFTTVIAYDASDSPVAARVTPGKYTVGAYDDIRGTVPGLDAHHVGQKAVMRDLVPGYDPATAPAILVPKAGHTRVGPTGRVSTSTEGFTSARDVVARDIRELRRVYPDVPNSQLQQLIQMNKDMYPVMNK